MINSTWGGWQSSTIPILMRLFLQAIIPTCTSDLIWIKHANHKKLRELTVYSGITNPSASNALTGILVLFLREDAL